MRRSKAETILAADKGICLKFLPCDSGEQKYWAATLVNRGTGRPIATGFGKRKEQARQNLEEEIERRAEDYYAHCVNKLAANKLSTSEE